MAFADRIRAPPSQQRLEKGNEFSSLQLLDYFFQCGRKLKCLHGFPSLSKSCVDSGSDEKLCAWGPLSNELIYHISLCRRVADPRSAVTILGAVPFGFKGAVFDPSADFRNFLNFHLS